jgi:hypothetical protein
VQAANNRPVTPVTERRSAEPGFVAIGRNPLPSAPALTTPPSGSPGTRSTSRAARQQPVRAPDGGQALPPAGRKSGKSEAGRGRVADLAGVLDALDESAPARGGGKAAGRDRSRNAQLAARDAKAEVTRDSKGKSDAKGAAGRDKDRDARAGRTASADEPAGKGKKGAPVPKEPSRVWVQVAGGANRENLQRAFAQVKDKAPKLLGSRGAWTVPNRATNRVLVGPFSSAGEAQEFVNKLAKSDVSAFTFTSDSGQKVEKLPPK